MSWSVSATGKAEAVAKKLAVDFERVVNNYKESSEGGIAAKIGEAVAIALANTNGAVEVFASGSFSGGLQSATLTIRPLYGFIE